MMDMEELQKACETLAEAWNKALGPMEKLAKALSDAFGQMYASEEEVKKGKKIKIESMDTLGFCMKNMRKENKKY